MAPCQYQNTWPICALVVCSAAAVVTAADSAGVGFVESGRLAMTQLAVVAGHPSIAVWSLASLLVAIVETVS